MYFLLSTLLALSLIMVWFYFRKKDTMREALLKSKIDSEQLLRKELEELQNQTRYILEDPITRLIGWPLFETNLKQNMHESDRYQLPLAVLFIDIDDFHIINNALGSVAGDELLFEIAQRFSSCIRKVDTIARKSKDIFGIIATQLAKPETAAIIAQRILQALKQPFYIQQREIYLTASIGIAVYPGDGKQADLLLRSASQALEAAKRSGNATYHFYQQKTNIDSQRELILHTDLKRDDIYNELLIYYQPVMDVRNETVFCMDALIHWQHPQIGLIETNELIHHIEKQRLTNQFSEWMLRSACKQFLQWRTLGFSPSLLSIPINIKQLENSHFIYTISSILQESGFTPSSLLLEIKEHEVSLPALNTISFNVLEKSFNMLAYLGVKVALSDIGTGSFTFYYLRKVKAQYLKLGHYFVDDLENNPQTQALLKGMLQLATAMSLTVIAQGVTNEQQGKILEEYGCYLLEGQLMGAPVPEKEVPEKMTV